MPQADDSMPQTIREIEYPRLLFTEVQRFKKPLMWILIPLVSGIPAVLIIWAKMQHPMLGTTFVLGVLALCMIFPAFLIFIGLRTAVSSGQIAIHFFPIRKRIIPISEIESAVAETYHPIKEFGGWGWRQSLRDSTWAYTMSGNRGVRLVLRDGKKIMIGSQRAHELAGAIANAMGTCPANQEK